MTKKLFTKSAFKQALTCPTAAYYYHESGVYANQNNEDDFLQALADGGNQAGDLAKVYYDIQPANDLSLLKGYDAPLERTAQLMQLENVDIAEAAFLWGDCFVRVDILRKRGNQLELIEVKAKSWMPGTDDFFAKRNRNNISADILPYVYDVAFQKYVVENALGRDYTVKAFLMMADKSAVCDVDGINQYFKVVKTVNGNIIDRQSGADALRQATWVLTAVDCDEPCRMIIDGLTGEQTSVMGMLFKDFVASQSHAYVNAIRTASPLGKKCFACPFHSNEKTPGMKDGFRECWKSAAGLTDAELDEPLICELWGGGNTRQKVNMLLAGAYRLADVTSDMLDVKDSPDGLHYSQRKELQVGLTTGNAAMIAPYASDIRNGVYLNVDGLKREMDTWKYPLHMIDFETTCVALPLYKGNKPCEEIAFQFSHHVIEADGSIRHEGQYLNTAKHHFPNFDFVRALRDQLCHDDGTIFRYATHENSILRAIYEQLKSSSEPDRQQLMDFIDSITYVKGSGDKKIAGPRNMVDLLELVKKYYYHPSMKGSNSIKVVLPAILNSSKAIRDKYSKPIYGSVIPSQNFSPSNPKPWITLAADGTVENPYKHLDEIASFLGVSTEELEAYDTSSTGAEVVDGTIANGGAALAAYTMLQFSSNACSQALEQALLRYCELDTMSMVFIWEYFYEMTR